jgi:hypothetical protein
MESATLASENDAPEEFDAASWRDVTANPTCGFGIGLEKSCEGSSALSCVNVQAPARDFTNQGFGWEFVAGYVRVVTCLTGQESDKGSQDLACLFEPLACDLDNGMGKPRLA